MPVSHSQISPQPLAAVAVPAVDLWPSPALKRKDRESRVGHQKCCDVQDIHIAIGWFFSWQGLLRFIPRSLPSRHQVFLGSHFPFYLEKDHKLICSDLLDPQS